MKTVSVSASRRYDILIERGLLRRAGRTGARRDERRHGHASSRMIPYGALYGETVQKSLADAGFSVCRFVFPHGEIPKCAKTYLALLTRCVKTG